jgi:adenine-specific DNA glycosylase
MLKKCLDIGATDVMASPMNGKCVTNLEVHAYRAHRHAAQDQKAMIEVRRGRKRSWVGINEEKPFAYLREAMVSSLMNGICRIENESEDAMGFIKLPISAEKQVEISRAVGQWHFCAHNFTDDELIVAAAIMFKHALAMPELEAWRIPTGKHNWMVLAHLPVPALC